jgi:UDP-N-acetylmuramoyl-L-alanyl-D-glutamate--2,6-diaminopimelate ligase
MLRGAAVRPHGPAGADPIICGVSLDSRTVGPGDLFLALPGLHVDGSRFARSAIERGARAVLAATPRPDWVSPSVAWVRVENPRRAAGRLSREFHARPDEALTLIGITGTNGKTTVAHLVEAIARAAGYRAGRMGTVDVAFDGLVTRTPHTTPEAPEFFRLLAEMRDHDVRFVAVEVSSHALSQHRVEGARFEVAAFLNLSRDHLDYHRDTESYFGAKARLFEALGPEQTAVLAADDPYARRIAESTRARVVTFGSSPDADVRYEQARCTADGSSAVLHTPSGPIPVRTRLPGRFNLDNAAAAAACAIDLGFPPDAITSGVLSVERVPGRMDRVDQGQPFTVVIDFAHTEDALRNLLGALRPLTRGRLIVVFGCGGDRDRGKRAPMGRSAAECADRCFITSDNPRGEDPRAIVDAVFEGAASVPGGAARCHLDVDRRESIRLAVESAQAGDVVVVAGKGHETTQTIGDRVEPFDDRVEVERALARVGFGRRHA